MFILKELNAAECEGLARETSATGLSQRDRIIISGGFRGVPGFPQTPLWAGPSTKKY